MTTFYHGTSEKNWEAIKKEGVLWGFIIWMGKKTTYRHTYFSPDIKIAKEFGDVILAVDKNWPEDEWQIHIFRAIPLMEVRRVS